MAPTGDNALAPGMLADSSLRQIVRPSIAGDRLRVRLSNLAGTAPLHIRGASIARPLRSGSPAIDAKALIPIRFHGRGEWTIPAGAESPDSATGSWGQGLVRCERT